MLTGTEIKSIRLLKTLVDTFCYINNGELWVEKNISPAISMARMPTTRQRRDRKLLLNKPRDTPTDGRLAHRASPSCPFFIFYQDSHGRAKVDTPFARGKKEYDKRQSLK